MLDSQPMSQHDRHHPTLTIRESGATSRVHRDVVVHRGADRGVTGAQLGSRSSRRDGRGWRGVAAPPFLDLWRSVRSGGDTKTRRSRRTLGLPALCVLVLREHRVLQDSERVEAGDRWVETGLVFATRLGTGLDAANVRRDFFRRALHAVPGLTPGEWTPRELRHSFVSVLSNAGVPLEEIARLVGHSGTSVTEAVYRHELRPVLQSGASVMDRLFDASKFGPGVTPTVTLAPPAEGRDRHNA